MECIKIGTATLYHGDSLAAMREMPNNAYSLALVDSPCGVGMSGGNVGYKGDNNLARKEGNGMAYEGITIEEIKAWQADTTLARPPFVTGTYVDWLIAEVERLTELAGDLESQNENLQIEHDVMYARIRDANGQYTPDYVTRILDAEINHDAKAACEGIERSQLQQKLF